MILLHRNVVGAIHLKGLCSVSVESLQFVCLHAGLYFDAEMEPCLSVNRGILMQFVPG